MKELFDSMDPQHASQTLSMIMAFVSIGSIVIIVVGMIQWRKFRQAQLEFSLKQDMIARGMSAEEINQVMRAGHDQSQRPTPVARREHDTGQTSGATETSPQTTPAIPLKQTASYRAHA